jgi:plasmid stabilization system protein ParE
VEYEVILTPRAKQDLASIWLYLKDEAPEEATPFCRRIAERSLALRTFPAGYPCLWFNRNVHQLTFGKYSIVFGINETAGIVSVYRFWHGAQDRRRFRLQESAPTYGGSTVIQGSP